MAESQITRSIGSVSWIDPRLKSVTLPEVDAAPAKTVLRDFIIGNIGYRFSNFLEASLTIDENKKIITATFGTESTMYRGPSFLDIPSFPFPIRRTTLPIVHCSSRHEGRRFVQIVGARTVSPETIAQLVGAGLGYNLGGDEGARAGEKIGKKVAQKLLIFPPIWTELQLSIYTNGYSEGRIVQHSYFPSVSVYVQSVKQSHDQFSSNNPDWHIPSCGYQKQYEMDAKPYKDHWMEKGWGASPRGDALNGPTDGNPWGFPKP